MQLQFFCVSLMFAPPTCVLFAFQTTTFCNSHTTFPRHFFAPLPWNLQLQKPMLVCKSNLMPFVLLGVWQGVA